MISDKGTPARSDLAAAATGLSRLDIPEPCRPGVLEGLAALDAHLRRLERALEEIER